MFNGISHVVMLATPADLDDFALGFGLTEGLLADASELHDVEVRETPLGIEVQMEVAGACEFRLKERRRNLTGRTGCGYVAPKVWSMYSAPCRRSRSARSVSTLHSRGEPSAAQRAARAGFAAVHRRGARRGMVHPDGEALLLREDVGRHNALDKLAGAMSRARIDPTQGFVCVTSRASFEMVQKTAMIGASMLVAVSAPTALAVRIAEATGIALAGFAAATILSRTRRPSALASAG